MSQKKKVYVVFKGVETGVFQKPWDEVKKLVQGFSGAQFKGYPSLEEAQQAWQNFLGNHSDKKTTSKDSSALKEHYNLVIYTDGACQGNPGPCGSGMAIYSQKDLPDLVFGGYLERGTNNIVELNAFYQALLYVENSLNDNASLESCILADSQYSINAITVWAYNWKKQGWSKSGSGEIKNLELIKKAHNLYDRLKNNITVKHVKGHSGNEGNELADRMAVQCIREKQVDFRNYSYKDVNSVLSLESF